MVGKNAKLSNQVAFRGIAALWVLAGHLLFNPIYDAGFATYEHWGIFGKLMRMDFLAVDCFFVLSGCLLTIGYWNYFTDRVSGKSIDRFYLKRLARIYPLHLLAVIVVGLMAWAGLPHPISSGLEDKIFEHWKWTGILNLTLMHGWGIVPVASWNEPAWTVSMMFMLYVIFPNLLLMVRRLGEGAGRFIVLIAVIVAGYWALRSFIGLGANADGAGAIVRALALFLVGIGVARLHMMGWRSDWSWDKIFAGMIVLFLGMVALWWEWYQFDMVWFHALYPAFMLCLLRADGRTSRVFASRLACWLGGIAYALYILHYPVLLLINYYAGAALSALAGQGMFGLAASYVLTIAVVVAVAYGAHRAVEQPAYGWAKRQLDKRKGG